MRFASPTHRAMRARRATTGSSALTIALHPAAANIAGDPLGQVGEGAVGTDELDVALEDGRVGVASHAWTPAMSSTESRWTPNARSSSRTG